MGDNASTAGELCRSLAFGGRDSINALLADDFIGQAAEGFPLGMGGEHRGAEAVQRNLWWKVGRHFSGEAQRDALRVLADGDFLVTGALPRSRDGRWTPSSPSPAVRSRWSNRLAAPTH
ncbi:hypothetical protein NWT09_11950 [Mycolicibacterium sp. jd]|uniref:hypothetical protein n=1 Tax=unclassified Mycolicibacterium TaxID=2636767 RepID=UPI00351B7C67